MLGSKGFDPVKDIVDLRGKVIIVTGGNRGTGFATVEHLVRGGAKVYLAARDEKKANDAIALLKKDNSLKGEAIWLKLDLSDPREAKKAAEEFLWKEKRLDVLVNNAALTLGVAYEKTPDGFSNMVTVNYISLFVFTEALLPQLTTTALGDPDSDVRIINVSSMAHKFTPTPVKFEDIEDFAPEYKGKFMASFLRYAHSKLLEVLYTTHLQRRLDNANPAVPITVISLHPGGVDSFSQTLPLSWFMRPLIRLAIKSPERGAYTSIFAAASKTVKEDKDKYKGVFLGSAPVGKIVAGKGSASAQDEKLEEDLYALTRKVLDGIGL